MIENRRNDDDDDVIKDEKELETLVRPQLANKRLSRVTADLMVVIEPMNSMSNNKSKKSNYIGVLLAFMSTLVVSGVPVFVKKALLFKAVEQSAIRYIVQFFVMLVVIAKNGLNPFGEAGNRRLLVLRGFFGMATLTCWYISLKFINPTDSIAISYTNVIIVFIFARFTLDEHFSIVHLIALFMAVSGVFFIAQPTFLFDPNFGSLNQESTSHNCSSLNPTINNQTLTGGNYLSFNNCDSQQSIEADSARLLLGALAALGAAFFSASLAISMKKLCNQNVHFAISTIYASYVGVPFNLALCLFSYSTQIESSRDEAYYKDANTIMWQVGYVLAAAVCSLTSVVLSNIAMSYEDASKVMIIKTGEIFLTFLMQTIFLDIVANHFSIVGSLLIFCATLSVLLYKMVEEKYNRQAPEMIVNEKRVTFEQAEKPKWKKILFYKI